MRRFNAVSFVGGPLDGVCWPCVVNPDKVAVLTADGREHLYECDQEEVGEDGTTDYRMVPTPLPADYWQEWRYANGEAS